MASAMPIASSVKTRPSGAIATAPAFTARAASGISEVTTIEFLSACCMIQSSAASGLSPAAIALDQRIVRNADEPLRHHDDRKRVPRRDAIDLVFHRAGVGVDIDAQN